MPKLIIKKTDKNTDLEKIVLQHLTQDKSIQAKSVSCKNKDTVIINYKNKENINSLVNTLEVKLSNNFKIEKEQINNPKLKVIDIDMDYAGDTEIELDINERNFSNIEDKCKLLHVYTNERTKRKCAIIEVTSSIYKHVKYNKSRLLIDNKCARFGHSNKKCKNEATCSRCNGDHITSKCTSEINKCPNCVYSNEKFKTNNTNHCAIDSELCQILKPKIKNT